MYSTCQLTCGISRRRIAAFCTHVSYSARVALPLLYISTHLAIRPYTNKGHLYCNATLTLLSALAHCGSAFTATHRITHCTTQFFFPFVSLSSNSTSLPTWSKCAVYVVMYVSPW